MNEQWPNAGSVRIDSKGLASLIAAIERRGYQVIGPSLKDSAIAYGPIHGIDDLPIGWTAEQSAASFRLKRRADAAFFGFAAAANSLKSFLHPSEIKLLSAERQNGAFRILPNHAPAPRYAFLGVRACELAAAGIQDRILIEDRYADPIYRERRSNSIIIAVQCTEPSGVCFCTSMGTGPRSRAGFDLALTEILGDGQHEFLVEVGTELGAELLKQIEHADSSAELEQQARTALEKAERGISRRMETAGLSKLLRDNFDHPQWDDIAARCLACGNCTQVCPTCFCVTVEDATDVTGDHAERWRRWDSCYTLGFSYIHGGSVRVSTKSRYRQWLTHKLSYWNDQFGSSGCVGCGRCLTWCPVGIDITQEVAVFQASAAAESRQENNSDQHR